ncbi:hypothetical protein HJD18_01730 [Thermoleophilia bacterium SCSIO 60948]|nr:hypothetical protein HJD18_01730 [Thermoleophilia bacterium SCSIO 60948]
MPTDLRRRALGALTLALLATLIGAGCGTAKGDGTGGRSAQAGEDGLELGIVLPSDFTATEQLAPALDVARVRIVWNRAQPNCRLIRRGEYRWGALDRDLGRFTGRGVPLVVTIRGTPDCAAEKLDGEAREPKPKYRDDFARFAARAAVRYGPEAERGGADGCCGIEQLEIWNEPNIQAGWSKPNGREYGRFLELVSRKVRAADTGGEIRIVSGGLAAAEAVRFTREMFSLRGIEAAFDDYGLHTYNPTPEAALKLVAGVRRQIERSGESTPIAITEHGWSTCPRPSKTFNRGKCTTPGGQASMLADYVAGLRERQGLGVDKFLWYTPQDVARSSNAKRCPTSPKYWYGFFDREGAAKSSWERWVELIGGGDAAPSELPPTARGTLRNCDGDKLSD